MDKAEMIKKQLEWGVEAAKEEQSKIAAAIAKSLGDAEYQLRWLEGSYTKIRYGQLCEFALAEGADKVVEFCKRQIACWTPQRSSSAFSNTCHDESFMAYKSFVANIEPRLRE